MSLFKPDISKLEEKRNVQGLIRALTDKDPDIRRAAALALGRLRDPSAVPALVPLLGDKNYSVQDAAVSALVAIGGQQTIGLVSAALRSSDKDVRSRAISVLGGIGGDLAAEVLAGVLKCGDVLMQNAAVHALGNAGCAKAFGLLVAALAGDDRQIRETAAGAIRKYGERAVQPLLASLENEASFDAIYSLGELGDAQAIPPLARIAKDSIAMRKEAVKSIGKIGGPQAVGPLALALTDGDFDVREKAAEAIVKISNPGVTDALLACLRHDDKNVRQDLARSLLIMRYPVAPEVIMQCEIIHESFDGLFVFGAMALDPMAKLLKSENLDSGKKKAISSSIGSIGGPAALDILLQSISWGNESAWENISRFGADAVPPLLELIRDAKNNTLSIRRNAAQTLNEMRCGISEEDRILCLVLSEKLDEVALARAKAVPALVRLLRDTESQVCINAACVLDRLSYTPDPASLPWYLLAKWQYDELIALGVEAREAIAKLLKNGYETTRNLAVKRLKEIGLPDNPEIHAWYYIASKEWGKIPQLGEIALDPLMRVVRSWEPQYAKQSLAVLGAIGTSEAADFLMEELDRGYFTEAAKALGRIGDGRAVPVLVRMLTDKLDRRKAAASALVDLYRAGKLSDAHKLKILELRNRIVEKHDDRVVNEVYDSNPRCTYYKADHIDHGIGVPFPT